MKTITRLFITACLTSSLVISLAVTTGCSSVQSDYLVSTSLKFNDDSIPLVTITPDYPRLAVANKMQGSVAMSFLVGNAGEVIDIQVIDSPGEPFESAAVKALAQALYDESDSGKGFVAIAEFTLQERYIY